MSFENIRICVLRAPGTNCDSETLHAIRHLGAVADDLRIDRMNGLGDYHGLVIPGGFSYGDRVRSGAIMGKLMMAKFGDILRNFEDERKPILGICNGFQVLAEAGMLPALERGRQEMALGKNSSSRFECRWIHLRLENKGKCIFTKDMPEMLRLPVAHGEGKVIFPPGKEAEYLAALGRSDQVVFSYALGDGRPAGGKYPENPNGSIADIAALCNARGNMLGMMPHPERAFHRYTYPDWTRSTAEGFGDGYRIFKNMLEYAARF